MCEKCWADAYAPDGGGSQTDRYWALVNERNVAKQECTPREQAGQWWDEERGCDRRLNPRAEAGAP